MPPTCDCLIQMNKIPEQLEMRPEHNIEFKVAPALSFVSVLNIFLLFLLRKNILLKDVILYTCICLKLGSLIN